MKNLHSSHGGMIFIRQFPEFCIKGTAASAADSQDKPICKAIGMNNQKFIF